VKRVIFVSLAILLAICAWLGVNGQSNRIQSPISKSAVIKQTGSWSPVVNKFGALTNLQDAQGKLLFSKSLQEGFTIRYRFDKAAERPFYVLGDSISDPNAVRNQCTSIGGVGLTTQLGLNVTSGFVFDAGKRTIKVIRTITNQAPQKVLVFFSEIKQHIDPQLKLEKLVIGTARPAFKTDNCLPCQPWPDCWIGETRQAPQRAEIVCLSCTAELPATWHHVCLAEVAEELRRLKAEPHGCEPSIVQIGVDARQVRSPIDRICPGERGERPWTRAELIRMLTQAPNGALVVISEFRINLL
jgi:hypothetical protein